MKRLYSRLTAAVALLALVLSLPPAALAAGGVAAQAGNIDVTFNGAAMKLGTYNIASNNYVKLRDVAQLLKGTGKEFSVAWNGAAQRIDLTSGQSYQPEGGELAPLAAGNQTAVPNSASVWLDGKAVNLTAYTINGNNFFKLRDLGSAMDFAVDWDAATGMVIVDTTKGYVPETAAPAPNVDQSAMAQAMLAALEADLATYPNEWKSEANARLVDIDGNGVLELVTTRFDPDVWAILSIYAWKDGALQEVWNLKPSNGWEWYLCKNTITGERGMEFNVSNRGIFCFYGSSLAYPSGYLTLNYQYEDETWSNIRYAYFVGDEGHDVTQAEWQELRDQHQRIEVLMEEMGSEENVAAVRAQLKAMV